MQIIDQITVFHIHISHILTFNPMNEYKHLTPADERSKLNLTYNPMSGFTHISDQF